MVNTFVKCGERGRGMSRIGRLPINIPQGVEVIVDGHRVTVKGPLGTLTREFHPRVRIIKEDNVIRVERLSDDRFDKALHGLTRTLINNMIIGVTQGYSKILDIIGVGYRAEVKGDKLILNVGFSHPVEYKIPEGIKIECPIATRIVVGGIDKEKVGQVAAEIRAVRPPEPYKGKGIRYVGEEVRRKAGKAGKAGKKK